MENWQKFKESTGKIIEKNLKEVIEGEMDKIISILNSLDTEQERREFKSEFLKLYGIKISGFRGSGGGP